MSALALENSSASTWSGPRIWGTRVVGAVAVFALLWLLQIVTNQTLNAYVLDILMLAGINIILAVSLNLINGVTGQFSLGHAGFMAVGAYAAAAFTRYAGPSLALPPSAIYWVSILVAALLAALAGWLVGLPSLRLRGDYLAIVTLGFGQIIIALIVTVDELGGALGLNDVRTLSDGSLDEAFAQQIQTNFVWLWLCVVACILMMRNLAASQLGRSMRAVREDEVAAEAAGIDTTKTKVLAFVISSAWAGVAGGLYAHYNHTVDPADYTFVRSAEIVIMVVLGGLGSITGATVAAVLLRFMDAALRSVVGVFGVGAALVFLFAWLSYSERGRLLANKRALWWRAPLITGAILLGAWFFGRTYIESADSPGKAEDWLRYVIYSLILIALMLLRPQGLLGRSEFNARWFRDRFSRRNNAAP